MNIVGIYVSKVYRHQTVDMHCQNNVSSLKKYRDYYLFTCKKKAKKLGVLKSSRELNKILFKCYDLS